MSSPTPKSITVAGVCSGIGGFDLAFERAGAHRIWACELEKSCRAVLHQRFDGIKVYEDMTGDEILEAEAPDIFEGGTPCQGFSLAGLRKGLADGRSNLALRFLQLANRFNPRVILWENVPGVLSMQDNAFGCFLAGLVGADAPLVPTKESGGRWTNAGLVVGPRRTAAWRVLDSQYFGVAQRRERLFVVASPRAECPFQVLFEPESLRRNSPPSREPGKGLAADVAPSLTSSGRGVDRPGESRGQDPVIAVYRCPECREQCQHDHNSFWCDRCRKLWPKGYGWELEAFGGNNTGGPIEVATACNAHGGVGRMDFETETLICNTLKAEGFDGMPDGTGRGMPIVAGTVGPLTACGGTAKKHGYGSGQQEVEAGHVVPVAFLPRYYADRDGGPSGAPSEIVHPLTAQNKSGDGHPCVAFEYKKDGADHGDLSPTLRATEHNESHANGGGHVAVAFTERTRSDGRNLECQEEVTYALKSQGGHSTIRISQGYAVRRLTPTECERLQAFPDGWTLVTNHKGKAMADGPRYKALGNAVTVSVVEWLARRILKYWPE